MVMQKQKIKLTATDFMPTSEGDLERLKSRAIQFAKHTTIQAQSTQETHYIKFKLGREHYGILYDYAIEIIASKKITPIPDVPHFFKGIINHRGNLLAVLDLKHFFPVQPLDYENDSAIIIVKHLNITVGILTDQIEGRGNFKIEQLQPALPSEKVDRINYILGLHDGEVTLLSIDKILTDPTIQIKSLDNLHTAAQNQEARSHE